MEGLVQVSHYLLQQGMQMHVELSLLEQLDKVDVVGDHLPEVCHLLEDFGEELQAVGVLHLQLELQCVQDSLLELLDGLDVQQARSVCEGSEDRKVKFRAAHLTARGAEAKQL